MSMEEVTASHIPLLPYDFAKTQRVLAYANQASLNVVSEKNIAPSIYQELVRFLRSDFTVQVCGAAEFDQLLTQHYSSNDSESELSTELSENFDLQSFANTLAPTEDLLSGANDAPIIKLINGVISQAIKSRASDIHFEPYEDNFIVRYRVDGILKEVLVHDSRLSAPIISRLKIIARLDIAERRKAQDGAITLKVDDKEVDFRVSCMPTSFGERVVMRILDTDGIDLSIEKLGFHEDDEKAFIDSITSPQGMVLVTGPTGSGKSTTLYAALNKINKEDINILTAEDPVEFTLDGVGQVHVKPDHGMTFASALRSFLRQDPEVVMVGEIRDSETAEIGIQASLTGHLVFSTLHTNDAAGAVTRLIDMGIEPFLLSATLVSVLGQGSCVLRNK